MTRVVASSVRGPAHRRVGLPCQDAWLAVPGSGPSFAAVADGLGSRPHARDGAYAAVRAARDAWRRWQTSAVAGLDDLVRILEPTWRIRLGELEPGDCASTCLVYVEDRTGRAGLAQLGDGLIARCGRGGDIEVHEVEPKDFGHTLALGVPHRLDDWSLTMIEPLRPGEAVLLATDGVSEDLDRTRLTDLVGWVTNELAFGPAPGRRLAVELRAWPVPHHRDDKTLLVMWKP